MTKRKKPEDLLKTGRKTLFKQGYCEQAYKLTLLGFIDTQLATFFGVNVDTIDKWKKAHPAFTESLRNGKENADADIAKALYHRAKGYSHPDIDIKMFNGEIILTPLTKYYPPDTGACMAWLKNRQPKTWREKSEVININISQTAEELDKFFAE